jgi:hypothetical protein
VLSDKCEPVSVLQQPQFLRLLEVECCLVITALCDEAFQDVPAVIHGPPKIVRLAVNLHEHLVQVPLPIGIYAHLADPFLADLCGKQRAKSVPPKPNRFVAYVDPALVQQVLDIAERKWKSNVYHHREADGLGAAVKVLEGVCFRHQRRLRNRPARIKQIFSDKAVQRYLKLQRMNLFASWKAMWTHCYVTAKNTQSLLRSVYRRPAGGIGGHKVIKGRRAVVRCAVRLGPVSGLNSPIGIPTPSLLAVLNCHWFITSLRSDTSPC